MKVTINVKLVNSKFNQAYADKENEGDETEDNIKYLWEDEFEVQGNVANFKVINNTTYLLNGLYPNDDEFSFEIPDMTVLECTLDNGSVTLLPFSKKAISKTEKTEDKNSMTFFVHLKSIREIVNPMTGVYILKDDYPEELLKLYSDEEE
ncbi:MAG: hypothetical protein K0S53_2134 [Bacteroidetes bacterium]|jgi:hypothetical protein|nr:hypothetical protein [Bacteroidota bacterium]MDF2452184.1 hypothetical protein [Bacteroidota bacterium]